MKLININETIKNVRTIIKLFRISLLKNEMLQDYVKVESDIEKTIIWIQKPGGAFLLAIF